MNEIEKMYENANLTNLYCGDDYVAERMLEFECTNGDKEKCKTCDKAKINYPPFTVEKQLELYKYLCKPFLITTRYYFGEFSITAENTFDWRTIAKVSATGKTYKECIAELVNNLWQDLSKEERKQIKNILELEVRK